MERATVLVRGRVQGVAFRAHAQAEARRLNLRGFVRNRSDGSVDAVAEGPRDVLERWVQWCAVGPSAARVDAVDVQWGPATGEFDSFVIARSGA